MGKEAKIMVIVAAVVAVGVSVLIIAGADKSAKPNQAGDKIVREDSAQTNKGAGVTVVEFGDYQCPACASAQPQVESLKQEYGTRINFVFRNFPLDIHPNAKSAAEAAEAAGAQGKYWEMNSLLYRKQTEWSRIQDPTSLFTSYAQSLGLDTARFTAELKDDRYLAMVERDYDDAIGLNLNSTPTFFVNGQKVEEVGQLKAAIEAALQAATPVPAG